MRPETCLCLLLTASLTGCASLSKPPAPSQEEGALPAPSPFVAAPTLVPLDAAMLLRRMEDALGGRELISRLKTEHFEVERVQYNGGQAPRQERAQTEISRTRLRGWHDFEGHNLVLEQRHLPLYPYPFDLTFREQIVQGTRGWVDGEDTFRGPSEQAMSSARIAMRLKEQLAGSPLLLLREVLRGPEAMEALVQGTLGGTPVVRITARWRELPLYLFAHAESGQLVRLETLEDLPHLGDVLYSVSYEDWRPVASGTRLPHRLVHHVDGRLVQLDRRISIEHGTSFTAEVPESLTRNPSVEEEALGLRRSRFLLDWIGYGFPQDSEPFTYTQNFKKLSEGVFLVTGEFHNSLVVELEKGNLVVVEAPFSPEQTEALLARVAERWPGATVSHVVNTHWHWDHSGGLRTAVAKGIPIVAPPQAVEMVERMARHEKTVVPDSLAKNPTEPRLIPVKDRYTLTGKARSIELYDIGNVHAEGMLLVYLPGEKLVFNSDLFNPGLIPTSGVGGWVQRAVINSVSPFTLLKAGTYALELERNLDRLGLAVESLCGGHGPDVVPREELSVLSAYGDAAKFEAAQ